MSMSISHDYLHLHPKTNEMDGEFSAAETPASLSRTAVYENRLYHRGTQISSRKVKAALVMLPCAW